MKGSRGVPACRGAESLTATNRKPDAGRLLQRFCLQLGLIATALLATSLQAQVSGKVLDERSRGVSRATVLVVDAQGSTRQVSTDVQGRFTVAGLGREPFVIAVRALGYSTATVTLPSYTVPIHITLGAQSLAVVRQVASPRTSPAARQRFERPGGRVAARESGSNLTIGQADQLLLLTPGFEVEEDGTGFARTPRPVGLPPEVVSFASGWAQSVIATMPRSLPSQFRVVPGSNSPLYPSALGYTVDTDFSSSAYRQPLLRTRSEVEAGDPRMMNSHVVGVSLPSATHDSGAFVLSTEFEYLTQALSQSGALRYARLPTSPSQLNIEGTNQSQRRTSSRTAFQYRTSKADKHRSASAWLNLSRSIGDQAYLDTAARDRTSNGASREAQVRVGQTTRIFRNDTVGVHALVGYSWQTGHYDGRRGYTYQQCLILIECGKESGATYSRVASRHSLGQALASSRLTYTHPLATGRGGIAVAIGFDKSSTRLAREADGYAVQFANSSTASPLLVAFSNSHSTQLVLESSRATVGLETQFAPIASLKLSLTAAAPLWQERELRSAASSHAAYGNGGVAHAGFGVLLQTGSALTHVGPLSLSSIRADLSNTRGAEAQAQVASALSKAGAWTRRMCEVEHPIPTGYSEVTCESAVNGASVDVSRDVVSTDPELTRLAIETRGAAGLTAIRLTASSSWARGLINRSPTSFADARDASAVIGARSGSAVVKQIQLAMESISTGIAARTWQWNFAISGSVGHGDWQTYPKGRVEPLRDLAFAGSLAYSIFPGAFVNLFVNARTGRVFVPLSSRDANLNGHLDDPIDAAEVSELERFDSSSRSAKKCASRVLNGDTWCRGPAGSLATASLSLPGGVLGIRGDSRVFIAVRGLESLFLGSSATDAFVGTPVGRLTVARDSSALVLNPGVGRSAWSNALSTSPQISVDFVLPLGRRPSVAAAQVIRRELSGRGLSVAEVDRLLERDALDLPNRLLRRADAHRLTVSELAHITDLRARFDQRMNRLNTSVRNAAADPEKLADALRKAFHERWSIAISIARDAAHLRLADRGSFDATELLLTDVRRLSILRSYYR